MSDRAVTPQEDILARTLAGEARGEGIEGMEDVACTIMNRVKRPGWWGRTVIQVCTKPYQYSCWNKGDPNLPIITNLNDGFSIYREALAVARRAIAGELFDRTSGATHYFVKGMKHPPAWAEGKTPCHEYGRHVFFNDIQ